MADTKIWDKVRPRWMHNLAPPQVQSITQYANTAAPGIHEVRSVIPAPAWPPVNPCGPPLHGSEPVPPTIMFDRGGENVALVQIGPDFFAAMMRNVIQHV
jgi:hypothetical protein